MPNMSAAVSGRTYRGAKARNYERNRVSQGRWRGEHQAVSDWLPPRGGMVLDVPCGTGRFFGLYAERSIKAVGVDVSEEMLALARKKLRGAATRWIDVERGDALKLNCRARSVDTVVCVRLLHLVSRQECLHVLCEICRVAKRSVILTVRLAPKYVENPSSTTMPERWFREKIAELGFRVAEERRLSRQGWTIMKIVRSRA